jgi:hypothetical protein
VDPTASGFLTIFPSGETVPLASNLNFVPGDIVANAVAAKLGGGAIEIFNSQGCTHVVVDVYGYFTDGPAHGGGLGALTPARLLDTRIPDSGGCDHEGETRRVRVAGFGGVPRRGAAGAILNVTAVAPTASGYLTVFPADNSGAPPPAVSNLNFVAGQVVPNLVAVPLGVNGNIDIFNFLGCTHLVVDVVGWFAGGAPGPGGFIPTAPRRLLDSREPGGGGCVDWGTARTVAVTGFAEPIAAAIVNLTAVAPTAAGFLSAYPTGSPQPPTSNVNFVAGQVVPNLVVTGVGDSDSIDVFNSQGCTHVVVDVFGAFAAA